MQTAQELADLTSHLLHLHRRFTPSGSKLALARSLMSFLQQHQIASALFGSYATETAIRDRSSVDLLIAAPDPSTTDRFLATLTQFANQSSFPLRWEQTHNRITITGGPAAEQRLHCYLVPGFDIPITLSLPNGLTVTGSPLALPQQLQHHPLPDSRTILHLLKLWRHLKNIPLPSVYVDALGLAAMQALPADLPLPVAMQQILRFFVEHNLQPISLPAVTADLLTPALPEFAQQTARKKLRTLARRLDLIDEATQNENFDRAFQLWNLIFTGVDGSIPKISPDLLSKHHPAHLDFLPPGILR